MTEPVFDANGWCKHMELAPTDGSEFLAWNGECRAIAAYVHDGNEWGFRSEATFIGRDGGSAGWTFLWPEITLWKPLGPGPVDA